MFEHDKPRHRVSSPPVITEHDSAPANHQEAGASRSPCALILRVIAIPAYGVANTVVVWSAAMGDGMFALETWTCNRPVPGVAP